MTAVTALAPAKERVLGIRVTPINRRRIENFKANRRGYWSLWIFLVLFFLSLGAEFIANDRPLLVRYDGSFYFPAARYYPETTFGGDFEAEADYRDPYIIGKINESGWILWPPIPYSYTTHIANLPGPAPTPPSAENWLGTDDQARDVLARVIYGFRISVLFGLALTVLSSVIGVVAGALQGFFGGLVDLLGQRAIEIWSGLPALYILIILASVVQPTFWILLGGGNSRPVNRSTSAAFRALRVLPPLSADSTGGAPVRCGALDATSRSRRYVAGCSAGRRTIRPLPRPAQFSLPIGS